MAKYDEAQKLLRQLNPIIDRRIENNPNVKSAIKAKKATVESVDAAAKTVTVRFPFDTSTVTLPYNPQMEGYLTSGTIKGKAVSVWYYQSLSNGIVMQDDVWKAASSGGAGGSVTGVKGNNETAYRTGNVNLTSSDIGAQPALTQEQLNAVNSGITAQKIAQMDTATNTAQSTANSAQTTANTAQSTADSKYTKPSSGIPESDLSDAVKTKLNKEGGVSSVNGQTGAVNLTAADVGAFSPTNLPDAVKDAGDGRKLTFAYSKDGLTTASWLAAWNGNELRAISPDVTRSVINAVDKAGDTMTGNLTFQGSGVGIRFNNGSNREDYAIRFFTGASAGYGDLIQIGDGGTTIVGAGESADTTRGRLSTYDTESLYLTADDNIYFISGADSVSNFNTPPASITPVGIFEKGQRVYSPNNRPDSIVGNYTYNGGQQPPSYVGTYSLKCNMMNGFTGLTMPSGYSGYMDVLLMNAYSWSDVPYATAFGIQKTNGAPRAYVAAGQNGNSWGGVAELYSTAHKPTASDVGALPLSGGTLTGKLHFKDGNAVADEGAIPYFLGMKAFASAGTVVYRSATQILDDLGGLKKSGGTMTGSLICKCDNDFISHTNEFNFGNPNGALYYQYRNATVTEHRFCNGNGSGGLARVVASEFSENGERLATQTWVSQQIAASITTALNTPV